MHDVERAIARIAGAQDNMIGREQLVAAGLGRGAIAHRLRSGWMRRWHASVYLIGPAPPTPLARKRAAALACGRDAMISHRSAAELLGLLPEAAGDVEVTVPGRNPGRHAGIRVHRVARLAPEDVIVVDGLRVTSVARTICDLAATEPTKDCEAALQEAKYRRLVTDERIAAVLTREPTRRGAPVVQALLRDPRLTRSGGERALLKLIAQAQLPRPETNFRWHGFLLDAYWPDHGLVVEVDGWDAHGHRGAFERDRKRDQVLLAHGLRVLRITGRQLLEEPIAVAARIAAALRG